MVTLCVRAADYRSARPILGDATADGLMGFLTKPASGWPLERPADGSVRTLPAAGVGVVRLS